MPLYAIVEGTATIPDALTIGATAVDRVYQGPEQLWPYVPPPSGTLVGRWKWGGSGNLNTLAGTFEQVGTNGTSALGFNKRDADGVDHPTNGDFAPGDYTYGGVPFTGLSVPASNTSGPSGNGYWRYNDTVQADLTEFMTRFGELVVGTTYELWRD